ncbi:MAG: hypothetical protein ABR502_03200 [Chitinophagaceae bacterium]
MNTGMDPEVKKYFRKILNSFSIGFVWLFGIATAGLYFKLGHLYDGIRWYNILFYVIFFGSFFLVLWYYYKSWKDG